MKPAFSRHVALALLMLVSAAGIGRAESLRSVLGNGGQSCSAGATMLQGTVGQAIVGVSNGSGAELQHGFWSYASAQILGVDGPGGVDAARVPRLGPAYPSPSKSGVRFDLKLPAPGLVKLGVYDVAGREVGQVFRQSLDAGTHVLEWHATGENSGVFFARLSLNGRTIATRRIVLR